MQQQILALDSEIEYIFQVSSWPAYKPNTRNIIERRYLSILKSVLKEMTISFTSASFKLSSNNRTINTTMYTLAN
jgi:hypothetical protein